MQLIPTTTKPIPAYRHLAGQHYTGRPSRALRRRLRTPEKMSVSQWAEKFRRVTGIDSNPGPWRNDLVPHLIKPMDTVSLPHVREVWICAPERGGKTQLMLNTAFWGIDQGSKGGSIFWLMPREKDARDAMADRIIPALKARDDKGRPNRLIRYLSDKDDDTKRGMIRFNHGMFLRPAWSNSPAALAAYFGFINIADEVDKFETTSKEGTTPIELFRKRARDDRKRSKYVFGSTPGAGRYIYDGVMDCDQVWQYHLRCPDCGELVFQTEEHLHFDDDTDVTNIKKRSCQIACPECGTLWDDEKRLTAYNTGTWVCISGQSETRPETVGFHLSGFCLPKIPLVELGEKWLRAKDGSFADKSNWAQGYRCENYSHAGTERADSAILALCDTRPANIVPVADISELLLTIDTQKDHFWYVLRAHGYGMTQESWLISCGVLPSFSAIDQMLDEHVYYDAEGGEHHIGRAMIDTGGTRHADAEHSRTYEVYDWARARKRRVFPYKGARASSKPWTISSIDNYPNGKPMRGGLKLYNVNANYYKDELDRRLQIIPGDPGAFNLHSGFTVHQLEAIAHNEKKPQNGLAEYARHMIGEYCDNSGQWLPHNGKRHDLWDCEYMQIALADILRLKHIQAPVSDILKPRRRTSNKRTRND